MHGELELRVLPSNDRVSPRGSLEWALEQDRRISYVGMKSHALLNRIALYICTTQRETYRILMIMLNKRQLDLSGRSM